MAMHQSYLSKDLFLPELKLVKRIYSPQQNLRIYLLQKISEFEVCPKCATPSKSVYDHVVVSVKDAPIRNKRHILKIKKRRFKCVPCNSVFRE
jgi:transposase